MNRKIVFLISAMTVLIIILSSCSILVSFTKTIPLNQSSGDINLTSGNTEFDSMALSISLTDLPLNHTVTSATLTVVVNFTASGSLNPSNFGNGADGTIKFCLSENPINDSAECNNNAISSDLSYYAGGNTFNLSNDKIKDLLNAGYRALYFGFIINPSQDGDITVQASELTVVGKKPVF